MDSQSCLIIFVRNPTFGKVKSRLAAEIGEAEALAVYLKLVNHTMEVCQNLAMNKVVYYSDFVDTEDEWDNSIFQKEVQEGEDLGLRMKNAIAKQFDIGFRKVCIIGSDVPDLEADLIKDAFDELEKSDLVIGPSNDGGYYLLGQKQLIPDLFINKQWSHDSVFSDTIKDLENQHVKYSCLKALTDIDTKEDLLTVWPEFQWKRK